MSNWIDYCRSEVAVFHPVLENALETAISNLGLESKYCVVHHQMVGTLEIDYAIKNIDSGKYLCIFEVKRTPNDVKSTRYQYQAMSYAQMTNSESEQPFYAITNLEELIAFRFDPSKPKVFQQILTPGIIHIGSFSDDEDSFKEKLADELTLYIDGCINNDYTYLTTLDDFVELLESVKADSRAWNSVLAGLLYEYIRGSFSFVGRDDYKDIALFGGNVEKICREGAKVDFSPIFSFSTQSFSTKINLSPKLFSDVYEFAFKNITADTIADLIYETASSGREHDGDVPTDKDLADAAAFFAKYYSGALSNDSYICDPAAGSGNLISSAISVYNNLLPFQIKANDINPQYLALLSVRLGLKYSKKIMQPNCPEINCSNICALDKSYFDSVKVILLNPPFVAGINCIERKQEFFKRINELSNEKAMTDVGQMALEGPFLELLLHLASAGTTIACILPRTILTARSKEGAALRRMLLGTFGLKLVFCYPKEGLFESVSMETCLVVGVLGSAEDEIIAISSYNKIADIDLHILEQKLGVSAPDVFSTLMPGVEWRAFDRSMLLDEVDTGWRHMDSETCDSGNFIETKLLVTGRLVKLKDCGYKKNRGKAANNGGSDLLFLNASPILYDKYSSLGLITKPSMRNANCEEFIVGKGDSAFLDITENDHRLVKDLVMEYIAQPKKRSRQQRRSKSVDDWLRILSREARGIFPANSILIPRAIRKTGKCYLATSPVFVSTNFIVISAEDDFEAYAISSWMNTVFFQLLCELNAKNQEGMRKMEVCDFDETYIPDLSSITDSEKKQILSIGEDIKFLELASPCIRRVDQIWGKILFGLAGDQIAKEAADLVEYLCLRRNPSN